MANKIYPEFTAGVPAGTDIVLYADPATGELHKVTIDDLFAGMAGSSDVESGTYQPVADINLGNLTSAGIEERLNWFRVGNCVTVSGNMRANPINIGQLTYFTIPTPTSMAFNPEDECGGTGAVWSNPNNVLVAILANDDDEVKFSWTPTSGADQLITFMFMYRIQ